jgi:hypothetical protein
MDGVVDFNDIQSILAYHFNDGMPATYTQGDLANHGVVNGDDIQFVLSANYNTLEKLPGSGGGGGSASKASKTSVAGATTLTGRASPQTTTAGTVGDQKPDFVYNPATGDLTFFTDGLVVKTTSGTASYVGTMNIFSASGKLIVANINSAFANGGGANVTSTNMTSSLSTSPGFTDGSGNGTFDLGNILPLGLTISDLTGDLTVKYQIVNGGLAKVSDVIVPEPTGLGLIGLGAVGLLGRRRRKSRSGN